MEQIRERLEAYSEVALRKLWRFRTGRDSRLELERADDEFGDVTGGDRIAELARVVESASFDAQRESARRLKLELERAFVARRTRELQREWLEAEASARPRVAGREASFGSWRLRAGAEADVEVRARIADALDAAEEPLCELRCELYARGCEALVELGYASSADFARALSPSLDVDAWTAEAARLLDATEGLYRDSLHLRLGELGVDSARANRADELRLWRLVSFEGELPAKRPAAVLSMLVRDLDVRLASSLELDLEARPRKDWRSFCLAPRVPGEVGVSVQPGGGHATLAALLRGAGEGLALAFSAADLPVEGRRSGDPGLSALWGELCCARISDPRFVEELMSGPIQESFTRAAREARLARIRDLAVRVALELELASLPGGGDAASLLERTAETLSDRSGIAIRPSAALSALDATEPLPSLHLLRGACVEVRLAEWLRLEFGERFWRVRRAGELLKELWNTGTRYDLDGIASELGLGEISIEPLVDSLLP